METTSNKNAAPIAVLSTGIGILLIASFASLTNLDLANAQQFLMTGAAPNTSWLDGCVVLDDKGFIKTGTDLSPENLSTARWPLARPPYLLETSLPGVFAVGDVRSGSIKRVASAVGEGSIAISFIHKVLQE